MTNSVAAELKWSMPTETNSATCLPATTACHINHRNNLDQFHQIPSQRLGPAARDTCIKGNANRYCEVWACLTQPALTCHPSSLWRFPMAAALDCSPAYAKVVVFPLVLQRSSKTWTCGSCWSLWFLYQTIILRKIHTRWTWPDEYSATLINHVDLISAWNHLSSDP